MDKEAKYRNNGGEDDGEWDTLFAIVGMSLIIASGFLAVYVIRQLWGLLCQIM